MKKIVEGCDIIECAKVVCEGLEYDDKKCGETVSIIAMLLRDNLGVREGKELGEVTFEKFRDFTNSLEKWFGEDIADRLAALERKEHKLLPIPMDVAVYEFCGVMATEIIHDVLGMKANQTDLREIKASIGL